MSNKSSPKSNLDWQFVKETTRKDYKIFQVSQHQAKHPETKQEHQRVVLEAPDWVNVIALTKQNEVIAVRQYRHGIQSVTTEIPGGMIDEGELPLTAAKRELEEETGYIASEWDFLGVVQPNPAFQTNRCWSYLARNAEAIGSYKSDSGEVIEVEKIPLSQISKKLLSGEIQHSLVITAFFFFQQQNDGWHPPNKHFPTETTNDKASFV